MRVTSVKKRNFSYSWPISKIDEGRVLSFMFTNTSLHPFYHTADNQSILISWINECILSVNGNIGTPLCYLLFFSSLLRKYMCCVSEKSDLSTTAFLFLGYDEHLQFPASRVIVLELYQWVFANGNIRDSNVIIPLLGSGR